jgi:hypothetical protein
MDFSISTFSDSVSVSTMLLAFCPQRHSAVPKSVLILVAHSSAVDVDWKSDRSGMLLRGGTKVVKAEPVPIETAEDFTLVIDPMVLMEPVGDLEVDLSG